MTPEQIAYVKGELAKGSTPDDVKAVLRNSAYSEELIDDIFAAVAAPPASSAVLSEQPVKRSLGWVKILLIVAGTLLATVVVGFFVLTWVVSSSLGSARDAAGDAAHQSQLNSLRVEAEIYFDDTEQSYLGFCSQGGVWEALDFIDADCSDSDIGYRMSTKLNSGEYYCVDSAGGSGLMDVTPTGLSCW